MGSITAEKFDVEKDDPFLWLEEIAGEHSLSWVRERNAEAEAALAGAPGFAALESDLLRILDSKEKIPFVSKRGALYYNFWRDEQNPRGLLRRTTLEEYRKAAPAWVTVLDLDALCTAENENWTFQGIEYLKPEHRLALLKLSRGGADAAVIREFDLEAKTFIPGGFTVPEAKTDVSWIDENTIFIGTEFGPGSLTTSGYPRIAKRWRRGAPLAEAETVFEGAASDMVVNAWHDPTPGFERDFIACAHSFFSAEVYVLNPDGGRTKIDVPLDAYLKRHREWLIVSLRTPWAAAEKTYPAGALLAARFDDFLAGGRDLILLYAPDERSSRAEWSWTRHSLLIQTLEDVKTRAWALTPGHDGRKPEPGGWKKEALPGVRDLGQTDIRPVDEDESDEYFLDTTDFLTPTELSLGKIGGPVEKLKAMPAFFDAAGLETTQAFAVSDDGTRVPYFQVAPKNLRADGSHPTLLSGYGGFELPSLPYYSGTLGKAWLEAGGVYALANIRGGGEYGSRWHQAALKERRPRAYEDFAAVARDLVARGVTSSGMLGIMGGSNGGLLVGNMLVRYPRLFGAIVCQMPLLDMKHYARLLAGASWIDEYGDPDKPEEWNFIRGFSPYHNVKQDASYPPVLFMTTGRDDRVHPGHARKMAALMRELGHEVLFWENVEGGHGAGADNRQMARFFALAYTFLRSKLGLNRTLGGTG